MPLASYWFHSRLGGTTITTLAQIKREKIETDLRLLRLALTLIEKQARKVLVAHANLDEFVMAMGSWSFTRRNKGLDIFDSQYSQVPSYVKSFAKMMQEFTDLDLGVTGEPMRFTAAGPVVRDWGVCTGLDGTAIAKKGQETTRLTIWQQS